MTLNDKQKKYFWMAAIALVPVHFMLPHIVSFYQMMTARSNTVAKASPVQVAHVAPPTPPPSPEEIAASKYGGVWAGNELMPDQNRCSIRLEIRLSNDASKKLKGYESKTCIQVQPLAGGTGIHGKKIGDLIRDTSPVSAVMTGTPTDEGITFTVDFTIGVPYDRCTLMGMALTDFGLGQLQAQWQSQLPTQTPCPDNRMLLKKARE